MAGMRLQNNGWITVPWAEAVGLHLEHAPQISAGYSAEGTQGSYSIFVNGSDLGQACTDVLGTNVFNATTGNLSRTLPVQHPAARHLWAKRIVHAVPLKWLLKQTGGSGDVNLGQFQVPSSAWQWWLVTIGFEARPYLMLSDADMQTAGFMTNGVFWEYMRFCSYHISQNSLSLSRESGSYSWADSGGQPSPVIGAQFNSPTGVYLTQDRLTVKWHSVPHKGLFATSTFPAGLFNSNIQGCRNKLNNAPFLGYYGSAQSGLLRYDSCEVIELPLPVPQSVLGLTALDFPVLYDVLHHFTVWDPPAGNLLYRGHNLAPNPHDSAGSWYLVTSDGTVQLGPNTTNGIYQTTDLSAVFRLSLT